jgi:hypothetical protein
MDVILYSYEDSFNAVVTSPNLGLYGLFNVQIMSVLSYLVQTV